MRFCLTNSKRWYIANIKCDVINFCMTFLEKSKFCKQKISSGRNLENISLGAEKKNKRKDDYYQVRSTHYTYASAPKNLCHIIMMHGKGKMSRIYSFNYNIILAENAVVQRRHAIILALCYLSFFHYHWLLNYLKIWKHSFASVFWLTIKPAYSFFLSFCIF